MPRIQTIFLLIAGLALSACKPEADADPRLADRVVQVASVHAAERGTLSFTGVVAARVQSDLGFRVSGKVIQRLVDTGQTVVAGQPLMRMDPVDLGLAISAQNQQVAAARARAVQTAADEERYRQLVYSGAISRQAYDQAKAAADSAAALLSAAEAQEREARNQGDYALLHADADGTVVETLAEPGQVVAQGQTVIRVAHAGPREASVDLPETIRPKIGSLAQATLYGSSTMVKARLRQLSDAADLRTRTYEARYVLEGAGAQAPLGATVTLTLPDDAAVAGLEVPIGAIDDEGHGPGVWLLNEASSKVSFHPVQVVDFGAETARLAGGVNDGDVIVAIGGHFLHPGEHVRLADTKAAMQ